LLQPLGKARPLAQLDHARVADESMQNRGVLTRLG
jgi:hypothetical protein